MIHNILEALSVQNRTDSVPLGNFSVLFFPFKTQIVKNAHNTEFARSLHSDLCILSLHPPLSSFKLSAVELLYSKFLSSLCGFLRLLPKHSIEKHRQLHLSLNFLHHWLSIHTWDSFLIFAFSPGFDPRFEGCCISGDPAAFWTPSPHLSTSSSSSKALNIDEFRWSHDICI